MGNVTVTTRQRGLLVLGASGKLGRMLARHWQARGPDDWQASWQYRRDPPANGVEWQPGHAAPGSLSPIGAVLALWGVTPQAGGTATRDLSENAALAIEAMELAATLGAERVLHCSSAAVYLPGPDPLKEDAAGGDINPYGRAKLDMEEAIANWCAAHPDGPRAVVMRIGNVAGADSLFAAIRRGKGAVTLDRFDSGEGPWRSYVSLRALAQAIETLLNCAIPPMPLTVNVATQPPLAMEAIARAAGCDVNWRAAPDGAAPMVWLDTGRLARLTALPEESVVSLVRGWQDGESVA
ncbi:NAD-dependent epimerase/dehydratase family protein [Aquicoccus sp.]|uniref:NAD-dependent epimerase/dehydratase family protein n=1 Tax=Aquicoccus sp. TaxID=2055851 RepID=UPI003568BB91